MAHGTREQISRYNKDYRARHPDYFKNYLKKWKTNHPGYSTQIGKKWKKNNPEKNKAYVKVWYALKTGKIKKDKCFFCNNKKVEAHHKDYKKPLEVIWLCDGCHKQVHLKILPL
jgi:hypothetical protein